MANEKFATLDAVIRRALAGRGDENLKAYNMALVHARRLYESEYTALVEVSYGHRTVELEVQPNRTAHLPEDYVDWSMLAVRREGRLFNLLYNPALVELPESDTVPVLAAEYSSQQYTYSYGGLVNVALDQEYVGYGWPLRNEGTFSVPVGEKVVLFDSRIQPCEVLTLNYLSNDAQVGKATPIHPSAMAWFEFYILDYLSRKTAPGLAAGYREDAIEARRTYLKARATLQLGDVYEAMRTSLNRF